MADQLRLRGGDQAASDNFTGVEREVTVDTTEPNLRVHDGKTPGGHKVLMASDCLVVDKDPCEVTVNGDFEVDGDTNLGDTIIDGNLVVNGNFLQNGATIAVKTDEVVLTNPGAINTRHSKALCNILPPSYPLKTQEDANQYLDACLVALENAICDFDVAAIDEIQDIKDDIQKVLLAIAALENRLDLVEADIAAIKARLDLIEQAISILETELEATNNHVTENSKAIEALKVLVAGLQDQIDVINEWQKNHSLEDHTDVDLAAPTAGDYLVYKNGKWTNEAQCNMKCNTYIPSLATIV